MNKLWLGAAALVMMTLGSPTVGAAPITWYLQGVTFADGGTASGSFVYDATTNVYSGVNVSVTATSSYPATIFSRALFMVPN
ncbi:MAG: hypothetical protein ABI824_12310, partial [Acidobacteriota bacterium]